MSQTGENKVCKRCNTEKPLNTDFWYVARPRNGHPTQSWQSNCKTCWREINRLNKTRRRITKRSNAESGSAHILDLTSARTKSEQVA